VEYLKYSSSIGCKGGDVVAWVLGYWILERLIRGDGGNTGHVCGGWYPARVFEGTDGVWLAQRRSSRNSIERSHSPKRAYAK
jgi:hypothetical protein